jgi:hypothetical protein
LPRPSVAARVSEESDSILVALAVVHAALLALWPVPPFIAVGIWWNSNTIAHNFIHRPFFRSATMNRVFSAFQSVLLGIPQTLWRDRHLAHHAEKPWRLRVSKNLVLETSIVFCFWSALLWFEPRFFFLAYLPGYLAGLALCSVQGHWEHPAGRPVSHYGQLYNFLCFNDGYHAEHHTTPGRHWSTLPDIRVSHSVSSPLPPLLRWVDQNWFLELLERIVLYSPHLQHFVISVHLRAVRSLLQQAPPIHTVTIIGGGLFPRTALVLRELLPAAKLVIIDCNQRNLDKARAHIAGDVEYFNERFRAGQSYDSDLTIIPLCFEGDLEAIYQNPPSPLLLVHDWIWNRRGRSCVASALLLKRINLIQSSNPIQR